MEDNSTSGLSLSISRISSNPPRPYLLISRLTEKGIRIPIYRSLVLDKMNRCQSVDKKKKKKKKEGFQQEWV